MKLHTNFAGICLNWYLKMFCISSQTHQFLLCKCFELLYSFLDNYINAQTIPSKNKYMIKQIHEGTAILFMCFCCFSMSFCQFGMHARRCFTYGCMLTFVPVAGSPSKPIKKRIKIMTRKKNKNKLSSPTTTKKAMVTSMLMLLKENKTNKNKAVTTPQSLFAAYVVLLLFNLQAHTYKTQHSQQCTRAGRRNAQRTAKCYYFSWESFFFFLALSSCKAYWKLKSQQQETPPRNNDCFSSINRCPWKPQLR